MSCCNNHHACGKQLYWFCNLSLFQVEKIVQIGCLTAMVTDDVFPQKKCPKQSYQCYPEKCICAYLFLDF